MANTPLAKFAFVDHQLGAPSPVSATATSQQWPLGYQAQAFDIQTGGTAGNLGVGQFVYCQGSNVTAIGQFVQLSSNQAILLASANSASFGAVGVAAGNLSATNVFGWVQVAGLCDYARGTNSSIAAGAPLYFAGTSGILISGVAAGSRILNVTPFASYTSSQSSAFSVQLSYPQFIGVTASL